MVCLKAHRGPKQVELTIKDKRNDNEMLSKRTHCSRGNLNQVHWKVGTIESYGILNGAISHVYLCRAFTTRSSGIFCGIKQSFRQTKDREGSGNARSDLSSDHLRRDVNPYPLCCKLNIVPSAISGTPCRSQSI